MSGLFVEKDKLTEQITVENDCAVLDMVYEIFKEDIDNGDCYLVCHEQWESKYEVVMRNVYIYNDEELGDENGVCNMFDILGKDAKRAEEIFNRVKEECEARAREAGVSWSMSSCIDSTVTLVLDEYFDDNREILEVIDL